MLPVLSVRCFLPPWDPSAASKCCVLVILGTFQGVKRLCVYVCLCNQVLIPSHTPWYSCVSLESGIDCGVYFALSEVWVSLFLWRCMPISHIPNTPMMHSQWRADILLDIILLSFFCRYLASLRFLSSQKWFSTVFVTQPAHSWLPHIPHSNIHSNTLFKDGSPTLGNVYARMQGLA